MIQVNRIYLIFNRLVTKKFLVDTSDLINIVHYLSHLPFIQKKTAAEEFFKGGEKLAGDGKEKSAERTRTAQ